MKVSPITRTETKVIGYTVTFTPEQMSQLLSYLNVCINRSEYGPTRDSAKDFRDELESGVTAARNDT